MTRGLVAAGLVVAAACAARGGAPDGRVRVAMDGDFAEWSAVPIAGRGTLLEELRLAREDTLLFAFVRFDRETNLQALAGASLWLELGADSDLVIAFSRQGAGAAVRAAGDTAWRSPYAVSLAYAPTHASDRFEIRLSTTLLRAAPVVVRATLRTEDGTTAEAIGPVHVDRTNRIGSVPSRSVSGARADGTDLRVMTWNVGDRTPLESPEPFRRVLAAIDPDIILFDELSPQISTSILRSLLPAGADWAIVHGAGGGRQRTAVASRFALDAVPGMARVAVPDSSAALQPRSGSQLGRDLATASEDGVPTTGAVVRVRGLRLLAVPLDLPCCGRIGEAEDRARIMMADAVNQAARAAVAAERVDGVIVGGDLNLVGARTPLDRLIAGLDPAGADLRPAPAVALDSWDVATWRAPGPFPPGRLDWLLYSPSRFDVLQALAYDADALAPEMAGALGLLPGDGEVTDHLPVVVDFRLRR